jgi:hypothetical protein
MTMTTTLRVEADVDATPNHTAAIAEQGIISPEHRRGRCVDAGTRAGIGCCKWQ